MSETDPTILNLSPEEKRAFAFLFQQADKDQLGVVTGENAVAFFERTKVSPDVLGEIWQIADTENRGFLSKPGFCMVLRLIGHYQAGKLPSNELAFKPGPVPKFEGLQIPGPPPPPAVPSPSAAGLPPTALQPQVSGTPPIRVPPLDPAKTQQYSGLFERSGAQNGLLDGGTAKAIFERAGLPNEILGRIWMLADRQQRGALDQTEFIVAMHLLTSIKTRSMPALPNVLPQGLYDAAARRGTRQVSVGAQPIPRQLTGQGAAPLRAQSPLARQTAFGAPPTLSAQTTGQPWLVTPADKAKFDQFFHTIDIQGRGIITGEQAVSFFSDSRLPEDTLAQIWDLADINSEGQLNKEQFAVAMYLIRQQRGPNPPPLPAFLPPALIPPSMRAQQQQTQSTAPTFDNAAQKPVMPKSAADDLFGLDEPAAPQTAALKPQGTGASATRDPFASGRPTSPASPARLQALQQSGSMFKPFMPTSAFGAQLASQNTGGSFASNQGAAARAPPPPPTNGNDDLLGDNDTSTAEASKITDETTELANMSNQIGNLRGQMEQTQTKKNATQAELNQTSAQKRDLEIRLQQFRSQYEQEVRIVKELEQQLATSRESTKKLSQELALLEGGYQDLQTQHQSVSQQLQADQQENAHLRQRLAQINAEVARLKPELEKMKLDARQQKGLVSINKKQLTTSEGERDRLQSEKADLERDATDHEQQMRAFPADPAPSNLASPASTLNSTNPFFKKPGAESSEQRSLSPQPTGTGPTPSAFDALFGPSGTFTPSGQAASRTGTPPSTSFAARNLPSGVVAGTSDSVQSLSSVGQHTPSATPPPSDRMRDGAAFAEPPPPPESRQFTPSQLPVITRGNSGSDTDNSSTRALPPGSRAGEVDNSHDVVTNAGGANLESLQPNEGLPGAFPDESPFASQAVTPAAAKEDFDSVFANLGDEHKSKEAEDVDPFALPTKASSSTRGFGTELPPIRSLERDDIEESDSSDDESEVGFEDDFSAAPAAVAAASTGTPPPDSKSQPSPPAYEDSNKLSHGGSGERNEENHFPPEFGGLLPAREDPTSPPGSGPSPAAAFGDFGSAFHTPPTTSGGPSVVPPVTSGPATANVASTAPKGGFDDFDDFDNLADAKEADKSANDLDFTFNEPSNEFNPHFDSPAASMTTTMTSSQQTPAGGAHNMIPSEGSAPNGFNSFQSDFGSSTGGASGAGPAPKDGQHDWDAIFSGLDNSKNIDTSLNPSDPWGGVEDGSKSTATAAPAPGASLSAAAPPKDVPSRGGALTPGTEHDDPILKRLTGMGYPRNAALEALEKFDYDINKAVDHLTSQ